MAMNDADALFLMEEETPAELESYAELSAQQTALAPLFELRAVPLGKQPARAYLGSLNKSSQRTMRQALLDIVHMILPEEEEVLEEQGKRPRRTRAQMNAEREQREQVIFEFPWGQLRIEHTAIIRAKLDAHYKYTTANRCLSALRMVLYHAWLLEHF